MAKTLEYITSSTQLKLISQVNIASNITMVSEECLKLRRFVRCRFDELRMITDNASHGADAVQGKIEWADQLLKNLVSGWSLVSFDIKSKEISQDGYGKWVVGKLYWMTWKIRILEEMMNEKYYEHHGRIIEKHLFLRDKEDQIRSLRRKMVHRGNSLAAEKKLIKDIENVEESKEKTIANGLEYKYMEYWKEISSKEDIAIQIQVLKSEISRYCKLSDGEKSVSSMLDGLEKTVGLMEKEVKKMNELEVEIHTLISTLKIQLQKE